MTPKPTTEGALSPERIANLRRWSSAVSVEAGKEAQELAETTIALITEREAWVAERAELTAARERVRVLEGLLRAMPRKLLTDDLAQQVSAALSPTPEAAEGPPTASPEPGWRDDDPCDGAV